MPGARTQRARNLSRSLRASVAAPASPELIAGISVTIKGRELALRIGERIRWHRERADALIQQMKKLVEVERSSVAYDFLHMLGRYESPRALMEERLRQHEERAVFLAFVRDHLTLDAVYRLDSSDLKVIDVLPH